MSKARELTAPCGLDCFNCEIYIENITEENVSFLKEHMEIEKNLVACKGCRIEKGWKLLFSSCKTCDCVELNGVYFCFECREFPCKQFHPVADLADKYLHNMKLYNLGRIRKIGVEKWAEKEAAENRRRYFNGKFKVGSGPVFEK